MFFGALLMLLVYTYSLIAIKVYLQSQKIDEINRQMIESGFYQQKTDERMVLDYKKKIDDYNSILGNHKISSNIFDFIEKNTLPKIWFSNFDLSQPANSINLSGEADDMETLGRQIQVFEKKQDFVKKIKVFSSQIEPTGKVRFTLNISLDPAIFN